MRHTSILREQNPKVRDITSKRVSLAGTWSCHIELQGELGNAVFYLGGHDY